MTRHEASALAYLEANPLHHMNMIQPIRRGSVEVLAVNSRGVLLLEQVSGAYMLTVRAAQHAAEFLNLIEKASVMVVHQEWLVAAAARRFGLRSVMRCYQAAWLHPAPPALPETTYRVETLGPDRADDIQALYSHDMGRAYIEGRLLAGEMFGAFKDGELAGFIGLHEEGSMGMLEVLPAFRRQGVATVLMAHLCALLMERGLAPFSQFTTLNVASRKLHEAMGFSISSDILYWMD